MLSLPPSSTGPEIAWPSLVIPGYLLISRFLLVDSEAHQFREFLILLSVTFYWKNSTISQPMEIERFGR